MRSNKSNNFEYVTIDDKKYLMNDSFSNSMKWTIIILNDSNEILKPIYMMVILSIAISVAMIIIILVFQNNRVNYIIRKISELNTNLKLIRKGVYEIVLEEGILSEEELKEILKPENMIGPAKKKCE